MDLPNWYVVWQCGLILPTQTSLSLYVYFCISKNLAGVCSFCWNFDILIVNLQKNWSSGATESGVWIGNCNVKWWKSTEHKLHKIWCSTQFQQNEHTPTLSFQKIFAIRIEFILINFTERQILWSFVLGRLSHFYHCYCLFKLKFLWYLNSKFFENSLENFSKMNTLPWTYKKLGVSGATECKHKNSTKLHKIWRSTQFQQKWAHPNFIIPENICNQGCAHFTKILLCARYCGVLCSVDFSHFKHCNCLFKLKFLWQLNSKFLWVHLKFQQKPVHPRLNSAHSPQTGRITSS